MAFDLFQLYPIIGAHPQHAANHVLTGRCGLIGNGVQPLADGFRQLSLYSLLILCGRQGRVWMRIMWSMGGVGSADWSAEPGDVRVLNSGGQGENNLEREVRGKGGWGR